MALFRDQPWHTLSSEEVEMLLESNGIQGLTKAEGDRRRESLGANVLPVKKGPNALLRFLEEFRHPLIYVLLIAGIVMLFLPGHAVDAGVIFAVVLVNACVGFIQESQATAAIEALQKLTKNIATVIRDGEPHKVDSANLVPGDLVSLESGDRVPADLRLIRLKELTIDESMLTGESHPVHKNLGKFPPETLLADRKNLAYSGSLITFGKGIGFVTATGGDTEIGRISALIEGAENIETPLTRKIGRFSLGLTWFILGLALLTFFAGLLHGQSIIDTFTAAVALAVSAIPEGLPAAISIILAIGVTRMADRNAIIRKLPTVETLGGTTTICTDKTGTLTKNEMTVTALYAGNRSFEVSGVGYRPEGDFFHAGISLNQGVIELQELLQAGVLCNESQLREEENEWKIEGDPTEGSLLVAALKGGLEPTEVRNTWKRIDSIPFESERQYMATLHQGPERTVIYLKGAIERVLEMCSHELDEQGRPIPLDMEKLSHIADRFASKGLRVLGFARKVPPKGQSTLSCDDLEGMELLGLQCLLDPPRPEAIKAVKACQGAGISVKMITGDHALTAKTIASQIGLGNHSPNVTTGTEIEAFNEKELHWAALKSDVFARVAPEQKLRLVKALQAQGGIIAMTGDGVNDAPALKQANIGIAMGITGTEVAKEAADMILSDDNFASIEAAVEEGRAVYDNLQKFITWTLPTNGGEGLLLIIAVATGITLPILPIHLLWINMVSASVLGITLAFEPKEQNLMRRAVRDPKEPILTRDLLLRTGYVSILMVIGAYLLFSWELQRGVGIEIVRTIVTNVIVVVETVYLFNCRSLTQPVWNLGFMSNYWTILGALAMVLSQLLFVYAPPMQALFQTASVPLITWLDVLLVAGVIFVIVEVEKRIPR